MTFLEICQTVARESGTVPGDGQPASVVNQTGRLGDIVRWVRQGWIDIQNWHTTWRWMVGEFEAVIPPGTTHIAPADLGVERFADWLYEDECGNPAALSYHVGAAADVRLYYIPWSFFYTTHMRGHRHPAFYSVDGQRSLVLGPASTEPYVLRGLYRRTPQVLTANDDTPEVPSQFHMLIVAEALGYLFARDEAMLLMQTWAIRARTLRAALERDQLPPIRITPEPLG